MQVQLGNETLIVIICEDEDDPDLVCDDHQTQHHTNDDPNLMIKPEFQRSMTADLRRSKSFVRSKPLEEI